MHAVPPGESKQGPCLAGSFSFPQLLLKKLGLLKTKGPMVVVNEEKVVYGWPRRRLKETAHTDPDLFWPLPFPSFSKWSPCPRPIKIKSSTLKLQNFLWHTMGRSCLQQNPRRAQAASDSPRFEKTHLQLAALVQSCLAQCRQGVPAARPGLRKAVRFPRASHLRCTAQAGLPFL